MPCSAREKATRAKKGHPPPFSGFQQLRYGLFPDQQVPALQQLPLDRPISANP
jgi:hypothetical protein